MVRKGFTLTELLVVIAIIMILAAILFPVFAQAREASHPMSQMVGAGIHAGDPEWGGGRSLAGFGDPDGAGL